MAKITLKGNPVTTKGTLPSPGKTAPDFTLVRQDLSEATLASYAGKKKVLNIFPSIDTGVCAQSVREFNKRASKANGAQILNISKDLPFALKRFCGAEGLENAEALSAFRSTFAADYNLEIMDSPLKGLCARAVLVLDEKNRVMYAEQVPEITQEPNYDAAMASLKGK